MPWAIVDSARVSDGVRARSEMIATASGKTPIPMPRHTAHSHGAAAGRDQQAEDADRADGGDAGEPRRLAALPRGDGRDHQAERHTDHAHHGQHRARLGRATRQPIISTCGAQPIIA